MMKRLVVLVLALAATLAGAVDNPDNFVQWRPGLASSAQPSSAWLNKVREARYDVVINLAPPESHGSIMSEGGIVGSKGVMYVNIPGDFTKPSAEDFRVFSDVVRANAKRNVLVHCQVNMRASSFVFLYRVIHEGADVRESMAKLNSIWAPDGTWRKFIEDTLAANGKKAELL